jgi:hypothetical protein
MIPLVWTPSIVGAITLVSRAVDDSANLEMPQNGVTINVVLAVFGTTKRQKNTGTRVGHVWSSAGTLLGTATFTNESSTGWQQVNFATPIPVVANTTYIVSYFAPAGHYSADLDFFEQSGVDTPPLHALANGVDGSNAVFSGTSGTFPTSTFRATNYWVDVVYNFIEYIQ